MPDDALPTSVRRLDGPQSAHLIRLVEAFDDLQTVLLCCDRLVPALAADVGGNVTVEALWTLALLSYARPFAVDDDGIAALTAEDLAATQPDGKLPASHQLLLHLRDHNCAPAKNPREVFTVGLAQDADGAVNAVAVTSVRTPSVDEAAVRQAGAMAFAMCELLDERIGAAQQVVFTHGQAMSPGQLAALDQVEVAPVDA
jgi:hypothetical protein